MFFDQGKVSDLKLEGHAWIPIRIMARTKGQNFFTRRFQDGCQFLILVRVCTLHRTHLISLRTSAPYNLPASQRLMVC
jgi:hypothetical protein